MVDGARYEYVHTGGTWASSTTVVRGGQTWAGQGGLFAMHYTYTCNVGVACAPDATDFYGMGPDGVHYYGGTGADAAGYALFHDEPDDPRVGPQATRPTRGR